MGGIQKAGYLSQLDNKGIKPSWQKRWFVLKDSDLYYFKDHQESRELGVIPLIQYCHILPGKMRKECFVLETDNLIDPSYHLLADSMDEMTGWIDALTSALNKGKLTNTPPERLNLLKSKLNVPPRPKNNMDEMTKVGTFSAHIWESIISHVSLECLCNIALVCKPFYFSSIHRITFTPERLLGYWTFIFSVQGNYLYVMQRGRACANLESKEGVVHGTGMSPLGANGVELVILGLRRANTIVVNQYFTMRGCPSRDRFSLIFVQMKHNAAAHDFIMSGLFLSQARRSLDSGHVLGRKISDVLVHKKNFYATVIGAAGRQQIAGISDDVKRADDIQAQMRETFEAGRPSSNSHLVEILLGKWLITIKLQKLKLEFVATTEQQSEYGVKGKISNGKKKTDGEDCQIHGSFLMSVDKEGKIGFAVSYGILANDVNSILSALCEVSSSSMDSFDGSCVVDDNVKIQIGSIEGHWGGREVVW